MKALTISQPYASLIADGEKFVENRTWECFHRGPVAIHAGKGKQYLTRTELQNYPHGAFIAVAEIVGCVHVATLREAYGRGDRYRRLTRAEMRRLVEHKHTEGPFGIVLARVRKLSTPIPCLGLLGLWPVPDEIQEQMEAMLAAEVARV